jgi:PAS domain S-box-containing protein
MNLVHPDDLVSATQAMSRLVTDSARYVEDEPRVFHRSGDIVQVHVRATSVRSGKKVPSYFVVHVEDITSRRRATAVLEESENRFRIMADSCPAMMWVSDAEGEIQFINRAYAEFLGVVDNEVAGYKPSVHPDDVSSYVEVIRRSASERTHFAVEARIRRADGEWRRLGTNAEPRISSLGEYLGHVGICADITDRREAEQARQFEHSMIRAIHEVSLDGIFAIDDKGNVVSSNGRFLDIWKIDSGAIDSLPDSAVGADDDKLLSATLHRVKDPESFLQRIRELYANPDEDDHCEIELKDNRVLERNSTSLRNQDGEYLGRVWFFRDVTSRKQAEINLQNAKALADEANQRLLLERSILDGERQMLRTLIDSIPDFVFVKDLNCKFVVANSALAQAFGGTTPEGMLGKSDSDLVPEEIANRFTKDDRDVICTGQPLYDREETFVDDAGNNIYLLTTKVPLRDDKGEVIGIAGTSRNMTARKKMENALREAERKYHGIFDDAIVGIFQSTPGGRFLSVNASMARALGYLSPDEMIARITDIARQFYVDPKRREDFMRLMDEPEGAANFECEALRKNGDKIWLAMSVRAIRQDGRVVRYEGMCEDITERNLLRSQLLQAQKLEAVGQLAAGIAHEINTPIQYIGDNVRFLKDAFHGLDGLLTSYEELFPAAHLPGESFAEAATHAERIDAGYLRDEIPKAIEQSLEGVTRVSALVSAMKEFSHPGTKEKIPLDLNHAIDCTITVARNEWKYVADMETEFDPTLPPISCHPGEFNQAVLNLIINAAHAIGDVVQGRNSQKGRITIQTRNYPEWAEIRIQDTGCGIPPKIRDRVFDPFFTTKEIGKGTGQGLAIARSVIVDKHGGSIDFETEEGKGTTFIIHLPRDGKACAPRLVQ